MKQCLLFVFTFFLFNPLFAQRCQGEKFVIDFVPKYDFSKQGRYTHEYNPFLLDKAAHSMDGLEQRLESEGLKLHGRIIISGYEQQAVPSYYTNYAQPEIVDEQSLQSKAGCVIPPHNRFGLMTGFLFKDINYFCKHWFGDNPRVEHINSEFVEIFDGNGTIFQKDAFGKTYKLLSEKQKLIEQYVVDGEHTKMLELLIDTWMTMYNQELTSGNSQIVGTQDILFSVEYARHLTRSTLPLLHYYTGGDITYPIEVSLVHAKEVTFNAQTFVQKFASTLTPRDGKKTAYIFCSFVDGVGKSTMLGNIKNWFAHGTDISAYDHVDNSSSQFADVHRLTDDVIIVDLPAQISHFSYKPDGAVYVELKTTTQCKEDIEPIYEFVRQSKDSLASQFNVTLLDSFKKCQEGGYLDTCFDDQNHPEKLFARNLILLDNALSNVWIPFNFNSKHYLFNYQDISQIRQLVPLNSAKSHGLKNVEPAQMLFFNGVRFPLDYDLFLNDMIAKIKTNGIDNVVMVDFMSMYPRSCRENIRVNYLLQQMSLLFPEFRIEQSMYRDFLSDTHLFCLLQKDKQSFTSSFAEEVCLRLALYKILEQGKRDNLDGISFKDLTEQIKEQLKLFSEDERKCIAELTELKVDSELEHLKQEYGCTKEYVNLYQGNLAHLESFSVFMHNLFTTRVQSKRLETMWQFPNASVAVRKVPECGPLQEKLTLTNGATVVGQFVIHPESKEPELIEPCVQMLRANWYAALTNLLYCDESNDDFIRVDFEQFLVGPLHVVSGLNKYLYVVRPELAEWNDGSPFDIEGIDEMVSAFGLDKKDMVWAAFDKEPYCMSWNNHGTGSGMYNFGSGFGHDEISAQLLPAYFVEQYQKDHGTQNIMPTRTVVKTLFTDDGWADAWAHYLDTAYKNEDKKDDTEQKKDKDDVKASGPDHTDPFAFSADSGGWEREMGLEEADFAQNVVLGKQEQRAAACLVIRALATLELIAKDPAGEIAVRAGSKKDFIAAVQLIEKVVLPHYFNIIFEYDLFDDYQKIKPVIKLDLK